MASRFTPETRASLLDSFSTGLTVEDAARAAGISDKTLKRWIARGRKEDSGEYAAFVIDYERARLQANDVASLTYDELMAHLAKAVRKGSINAMKLWLEEHHRGDQDETEAEAPADPLDNVDELAERRVARA